MENGALVISLDFELLWGVFDTVDWQEKKQYFQNTRSLIPQILELFEKYEISCTWATVGMLFHENWDEWNQNIPEVVPEYTNSALSAYKYGKTIQSKETESLCFAPGLIKRIKETPGQEIGTHTYAHYYCLEDGQSIGSFKADLQKSIELAEKNGIALKSLVFPRNQFNDDYLKICYELGIENVRSNPSNWYWENTQKDSLFDKIFRTGDAYFGPIDKSYGFNDLQLRDSNPLSQKASRLLRPYSPNKSLNYLKLKRIRAEMSRAAEAIQLYHLWWHPHNFGEYPTENLRDLEELLVHFDTLRKKYGFLSLNMCETGKLSTL